MFTGLLHIHSLLRYVLLFLIIFSIIKSFTGWRGNKPFSDGDRKRGLFTMIAAHLQLVVGLVLYFLSPAVSTAMNNMGGAMKEPALRFWAVEHISMMIIAIVLITLGNSLSKRAKDDAAKHKKIFFFFLLGLILIFLAIPWPWSAVVRGWMPGM